MRCDTQISPDRNNESRYKNFLDLKYKQRKTRSLEMLNSGVTPVEDGFNEYWIPSQTDRCKKYKVTIKKGWYSCECPDNKAGNLCKHILFLKTYLAIKLKAKEVKESISIGKPCPTCESQNIIKDGSRKTSLGMKQRWLCKSCGKRFVLEPVKKIKGNLDSVVLCMDLYMKGCSYRSIADSLRQFYGLKITHVTVMRWIQVYMDKINKYVETLKPEVSEVWHADEQIAKIKGDNHFIWNCMDSKTRFLLANQVTPSRSTIDARALFQQAKETARDKAKTIVTDGAFAYEKSVKKEFWTHQNRKPHKRYVSIRQKDCSNNKLERYHGTFRQRDKTMRGFKTRENTQKYTQNFKTYYNFVKKHEGLNGRIPAQVSQININPEWKEILLKAVNN